MYVMLKDFHDRRGSDQTADAVAAVLSERCQREVSEAVVSTFGAPPVDGLGTTADLNSSSRIVAIWVWRRCNKSAIG